jgi:excisionase family DNA binding protein
VTPLHGLLRDDGAVVVPAAVAAEVLRLLARALVDDARRHGGQPTPDARRLLSELYDAAQAHQASRAAGSVNGTVSVPGSTVEMSVVEAAEVIGSSTRWVRRLAGCGRLRARRVGRTWLIDAASLDAYRHRKEAA